ncbi:hypothetical protein [Accumulibacter sp.]|uniref:hypothetical protein n=1 Tax=Accumulibacter sp. TaxID=2053492 RepID=UPI001A56BFDA|nr:hypothetical protein [Accumulibacter sp.]MBL8399540.1 hypothetical protein [Accumulibacter sp.]
MSFRVLSLSTENKLPNVTGNEIGFEMTPVIDLGLALPCAPGGQMQGMVNIRITGRAAKKDAPDESLAVFSASYEALFLYPKEADEADVSARFEREMHQYMLVAQAFPLASSHFRRELMAMGFNLDNLPLGL